MVIFGLNAGLLGGFVRGEVALPIVIRARHVHGDAAVAFAAGHICDSASMCRWWYGRRRSCDEVMTLNFW